MASIREIREAVEKLGGKLQPDGNGDWEAMAPHGYRWKATGEQWHRVEVTGCGSPAERWDLLHYTRCLLQVGVEEIPGAHVDGWKTPFAEWIEGVAGQPGWNVQPLPQSLRDALVVEARLADHWVLAYPQHAMIFRAGWEAAEDIITA